MDGFNLSQEFINKVNEISTNGLIVEFGSGEGTVELLKTNSVLSIEHDEEYNIKRGDNHEILLCPIVAGWYNYPNTLKANIDKADVIIVDGPPRELRIGILNHLSLFKDFKKTIIFDDVNRETDMIVMVTFCNEMNFKFEIIKSEDKWFGVCNPNE